MTARYGSASSSSGGTASPPGRMPQPQAEREHRRKDERPADPPPDPPAAEDDQRDTHPAAARDDVQGEAAQHRERDERAAHGHQATADDERQVADPGHVDARRVGGLRVLADGPDGQAQWRMAEHPPGERGDHQERDVGEAVLIEDHTDVAQSRERIQVGNGSMRLSYEPDPENSSRLANSERPTRAMVRPRPETCWLAPEAHGQHAHHGTRERCRP